MKPSDKTREQEGDNIIRVRFPKNNEVIGILEQRLGGSRAKVRCMDGKTRVCRIPGRLKRYLWIRENDIILVEPWELQGDEKGDIIYKYKGNQIEVLRKKGYLKTLENLDEF
jgi:translation initiation factor 1A